MNFRGKKQTVVALGLAFCMFFAACGSSSKTTKEPAPPGGTQTPAQASAPAKPTTITMMQELFSAQSPKIDENNKFFAAMQKASNTVLQVTFVPTAEYTNKVNILIASSDLPMVVAMNSNLKGSAPIISGAKNGAFWNITDYVEKYKNLYGFIGKDRFTSSSIEGSIYGIPRLRVIPRAGMFYRKDWAAKLGINPPETLDDMYNMAKAFTENDPDGNGKKDTWGMEFGYAATGNIGWNGIQTMSVALGGPNGWGFENGTMVPDFTTAEYMQALNFYKKLYAEGYINKDFAVLTGNKRYDVFNQGNAGMIFGVMDDSPGVEINLQKVKPQAELTVAPSIKNPKGGNPRQIATAGYNGIIMFNKTGKGAVKSEEELKKVLSFYDTMCTPEMQTLITFGIEGRDYTGSGNAKTIVRKPDGSTYFSEDKGDFGQLLPEPPFVENDTNTRIMKEVHAAFKSRLQFAVPNLVDSLISETNTQNGAELDKIIFDASVKYIMGESDEAGFKNAINTWKSRGGDKVIKEFTEQYTKIFLKK